MYYAIDSNKSFKDHEYYLIDLETLKIRYVSERELDDIAITEGVINVEKTNSGFEINQYVLFSDYELGNLDLDGYEFSYYGDLIFTANGIDFQLGYNSDGFTIKADNNKTVCLKFSNDTIEDLVLMYFFRYNQFVCFRFRLEINYCDPYYFNGVFDLEENKFIDFINVTVEQDTIFENIHCSSDSYIMCRMMNSDFNKYLNIDCQVDI